LGKRKGNGAGFWFVLGLRGRENFGWREGKQQLKEGSSQGRRQLGKKKEENGFGLGSVRSGEMSEGDQGEGLVFGEKIPS
jgi:hypothetical protein